MERNIALYIKLFIQIGIVGIWGYRFYKNKKRESLLKRFHEVYEQDDLTSALWHIDQYIEQKPKDSVAHSYKGLVLKEMDKFYEAKEALEKAVQLSEKNFLAYKFLGDLYLESGNFVFAKDNYEKGIALDKRPAILYCCAVCYVELGQVEMAEKHLKQALKRKSQLTGEIHGKLVDVYHKLDKPDQANKHMSLRDKALASLASKEESNKYDIDEL